jgi:hypothetical protein
MITDLFLRMYFLYSESLKSSGCHLNTIFHVLRGPVPEDTGTSLLLLLLEQNFELSVILIAVLEESNPSHLQAAHSSTTTTATLLRRLRNTWKALNTTQSYQTGIRACKLYLRHFPMPAFQIWEHHKLDRDAFHDRGD